MHEAFDLVRHNTYILLTVVASVEARPFRPMKKNALTMPVKNYKTDRAGYVCRIIRLTEASANHIREQCEDHGITLLTFYEGSALAYLKARKQGEQIPIVPTPFNTQFHVLTVRLSPPIFHQLDELSKSDGFNLGRILATMLTYGSSLLDTPDGRGHFIRSAEGLSDNS